MGRPNMGKSASLQNLENQNKLVYLNTDLKELPFKDSFAKNVEVVNAIDALAYIDEIEANPDMDGVILDTITFLMNMYERQYVASSNDTQKAWGQYGNFYREMMHKIKSGTKNYFVLAHEMTELNEQTMQMESKVPVKGAVGKIGVNYSSSAI